MRTVKPTFPAAGSTCQVPVARGASSRGDLRSHEIPPTVVERCTLRLRRARVSWRHADRVMPVAVARTARRDCGLVTPMAGTPGTNFPLDDPAAEQARCCAAWRRSSPSTYPTSASRRRSASASTCRSRGASPTSSSTRRPRAPRSTPASATASLTSTYATTSATTTSRIQTAAGLEGSPVPRDRARLMSAIDHHDGARVAATFPSVALKRGSPGAEGEPLGGRGWQPTLFPTQGGAFPLPPLHPGRRHERPGREGQQLTRSDRRGDPWTSRRSLAGNLHRRQARTAVTAVDQPGF